MRTADHRPSPQQHTHTASMPCLLEILTALIFKCCVCALVKMAGAGGGYHFLIACYVSTAVILVAFAVFAVYLTARIPKATANTTVSYLGR